MIKMVIGSSKATGTARSTISTIRKIACLRLKIKQVYYKHHFMMETVIVSLRPVAQLVKRLTSCLVEKSRKSRLKQVHKAMGILFSGMASQKTLCKGLAVYQRRWVTSGSRHLRHFLKSITKKLPRTVLIKRASSLIHLNLVIDQARGMSPTRRRYKMSSFPIRHEKIAISTMKAETMSMM